MKNQENRPETMKNQPGTMKNHENRPETMKNQHRTKNHKNRHLIQKRHVMDRGIQLTSFDPKKRDVTDSDIQMTSSDPKNVMSRTGGSNLPPLIQKT